MDTKTVLDGRKNPVDIKTWNINMNTLCPVLHKSNKWCPEENNKQCRIFSVDNCLKTMVDKDVHRVSA